MEAKGNYTPAEDQYIIDHYQDQKIGEIAEHLGRSERSVYSRIYCLDLERKAANLTEEQIEYIDRRGLIESDRKIASYLGISQGAVSYHRRKKGIKKCQDTILEGAELTAHAEQVADRIGQRLGFADGAELRQFTANFFQNRA